MKNLFALIGFGTIAFVGLGWYLGWYNLSRQPGKPGMQNFSLEVNPNKSWSDIKKGAERVGEIYEKLTDENQPMPEQKISPPPQTAVGPATQLFTPSNLKEVSTNGWNSLELLPPPITINQPVNATPPSR